MDKPGVFVFPALEQVIIGTPGRYRALDKADAIV
jgi:hypothetical protein